MRQKQKNNFSLRIAVVGGTLTAENLKKIAEVAEEHGEGYVHLTSRQGVEIPFIKLDDIDVVKEELAEGGCKPGVCGPRVRTVTACQGNAVCPSGNIDTQDIAKKLDERYFGRELPHKFKFGVTGCRNNCLKAEENDVGITVMKGFAGGRLFDEKRSPFGVSLTPVQCIHYALTRPAVCSIMCGYDTKEQVNDAVAYETATEEEKDYASVIANAPFHSYKGECTYCGHCKPCAADLDIAMINKFYDLATMQPEVPATIRSHYELLEHKASECIGCQECETRCPFGVPIAERMEKTAKLFGC